MKNYDLIIIGAGPAGLMAAICAWQKGLRICILEKNRTAGKKLLISGSGQCNITHSGDIKEFFAHYGGNERFVKPALYNFTNEDLISWFNEKSLKLVPRADGKIFPETSSAHDVLNLLLKECKSRGIELHYNSPVVKIEQDSSGFQIMADNDYYHSTVCLISCGGKSYSTTGSTGDGYKVSKELGHSTTEIAPALTPLIISDYCYKNCAGISFNKSRITIWREKKKIHSSHGPVLFTHQGLSGPGILNISRYIKKGDIIKISLVSIETIDQLIDTFETEINLHSKKSVKNFLIKYEIPENFAKSILLQFSMLPDMKMANCTKENRKKLIEALTDLPFIVKELGGFNIAMATRGGISLKEVNPKTMESRLVPSLFFAGEVLDIDGDTGGYNLQFAFSSGVLAGKDILSCLNQ